MADDTTGRTRHQLALVGGVTGASQRAPGGPPAIARWMGLAALIILVAGSLVTLTGAAPRPGPPPFLVDGEAMIAGVGISQYLPVTLVLSWALSSLGLTMARRRRYVVPWLAVLAGTWAFVWLVWNFAPLVAPLSIGLLLLTLNGVAICGAWRTILGRRAQHALRWRTPPPRRRRVIDIIYGVTGIALMGVVLASPAVARVVIAAPHGTVRTIAIAAPVEVDDGMVMVDQHVARACILLRSSYIQWPDTRVTSGAVITLDSKDGRLVHTLPLDFYPGSIVTASGAGQAFINAISAFDTETAIDTLHVLDLRTGMTIHPIPAGRYLIDVAADGPRHHVVAVDWDENTMHVLDAETGRLLHTIKVGQHPQSVVVAEHAGRVFVDNAGDDSHPALMSVIDARTSVVVRTVPGDPSYAFVSAERTGRVFGVSGGTVSVRNASSGALVATVKIPGGQTSALSMSEGTGRVFVANSDYHSVSMLDANSGRVLRTVRVGTNPTALAVDEQARRVFVTNQDEGTVSVLAATTGQVLGTLRVGVTPIAIGIDSRRGLAFVYNAASGMVSVLDTRATLSP